MWGQAVRVAVVGFSVVFTGLCMLALGVKIMSFFCRLVEKRPRVAGRATKAAHAAGEGRS
jgi:Na+-transporting methylmalonyl-CoA/oxaloacetate decarboxylase gamma subunit